jgi:hypothetical protein
MPSLPRIVFFGMAVCLGSLDLVADSEPKDGFAAQIARLPWDTSDVNVHYSAQADAQIVVIAHYVNPDVVADTDTRYISVHPAKWTLDKNGRKVYSGEFEGEGTCRDDIMGRSWCDGTGEFENVGKNGFDYHLNLTWKIGKGSETKFDETFHCLWVKEQTFKKNGFTITIMTKLK